MNVVKIYGLRRTGTNYLQWLLVNNFRNLLVLTDGFRWKHGLPMIIEKKKIKEAFNLNSMKGALDNPGLSLKDFLLSTEPRFPDFKNPEEVKYILCIKDPYSWYISICNWEKIEPFPLTNDKLEKFFLWNYMGLEYLKFALSDTLIIKYEDLLSSLCKTLTTIENKLHLDLNYQIINNHDNVYSGKSFAKKRHFYESKQYLRLYSTKDFSHIRNFLDEDIVKDLGYKVR